VAIDHDVKNIGLANQGLDKVEWAEKRMPVLPKIRERFIKEKPLKGAKIDKLTAGQKKYLASWEMGT
jgi:S-adenosylhomocysteine hydrolase